MYKELIVTTTTEGSDFVADAFFSLGVSGVKILDANDVKEVLTDGKTWDYVDDALVNNVNPDVKVSGFVSAEDCERKLAELKALLAEITYADLGNLRFEVADYVDGDWLTEWKKYYKPIDAEKYVVVPEWLPFVGYDGKTVVRINPTMAFGTGEHESTRLCLTLMSQIDFCGKKVADVGTGSGILGIAAAKSGAKSVYMCDIDSLSIKSAKENAALNCITSGVTIEESDLVGKTDSTFAIVLANLTADILIRLSRQLVAHVEKGGILVCSGIIHSRKAEVISAYEGLGFVLEKELALGEWDGLKFVYGA